MGDVLRGRTALARKQLSRPVRLALGDGLLTRSQSFFDYGCGRGDDLKALQRDGFPCAGWDPIHRTAADRQLADVVNLGYVANVIESPQERAEALTSAWSLAQSLLIVAARTTAEGGDLVHREPLADGIRTSRNTFQKFFEQHELKHWIETTLDVEAEAAGLGVFYVFRCPDARDAFRAARVRRRLVLPSIRLIERCRDHPKIVAALVDFFVARGRPPLGQELPQGEQITAVFGSIKRAFGAIRRTNGDVPWDAITAQRREDLSLLLALSRFERGTRWSKFGAATQADIRMLYGTYARASRAAETLLLSIGQTDALDEAFAAAPIGKLTPTALYVHRDNIDQLPVLLRAFEGCARGYLGEVEQANLVKIYRREPKISYLSYPDFDRDAHPRLFFSLNVNLREFRSKLRRFDNQPNPPILHRKELFVAADYPGRATFAALTREEEMAGLLADTKQIGLKSGWERTLADRGMAIAGHRLRRIGPADD